MESNGKISNVTEVRKNNITMLAELYRTLTEYEGLCAIYKGIVDEIDAIKKKLQTPAPTFGMVMLIGILAAGFGLVDVLFDLKILNQYSKFLVLVGIVLIVISTIVYVSKKKKYQLFIAELNDELSTKEKSADEAKTKADIYFENVLNAYVKTIVPELFPKKYCYDSYAVKCMLDLLIDMRADAIKEAINLFEEEEYRRAMIERIDMVEKSAQRSALANERSALANERSAKANEATAVAAVATAASMASIADSQRRQAKASEAAAKASEDVARSVK